MPPLPWRQFWRRRLAPDGSLLFAISLALDQVHEGSREDESLALLANKIVRRELDKSAIKYKDYRAWRQRNPLVFTSIVDDKENLLGFFDIFPLTDEAGREIIAGTLTEHSLTTEHILPSADSEAATYVHIATVLANPWQRTFPSLVTNECLLIKLGEFIGRVYEPLRGRVITAFGQSKAGEALLKRSGFKMVLAAVENEERWPLYVLHPEETSSVLVRFDRVAEGISARWSPQVSLTDLDNRIELVELAIRSIIMETIGSDTARLPSHVSQKLNDRIEAAAKKDAAFDVRRYDALDTRLSFCDLRELQDIIVGKSLWGEFQPRFVNKETLIIKFDQLAEIRNPLRHSRPLDEIKQKEGESAILWFERVLRKAL